MRKLNWLVALVALLFGQSAMAVMYEIDWRTVDGTAFVGKSPGLDRLWGTADDFDDPTTNPFGWSSGSVEVNTGDPQTGVYTFGAPLFSDFFSGSIQVRGDLQTDVFNYDFTAAEYYQVYDCSPPFLCDVVNQPGGPFVLSDPIFTGNTGFYDLQTQMGFFGVDLYDENSGNLFATGGNTYTIFNGQNTIDFIGDFGTELITHFDYILGSGALDPNWVGLQVNTYNFYVYSEGPYYGFAGQVVNTTYFTEEDRRVIPAVPEPTTLGLFAAGLAGLGFSARRRKQAH